MIKSTFAAASLSIAIGAALAPAAATAQAPSPETGVTCRPGTTAEYNSGVLRCRVTETVRLASICSGVVFASNGDINLNTRVLRMDVANVDQCIGPNGARADSVMAPPIPGVHPAPTPGTYRRVVNATAADVFVATKVSYEFPQGWLFVGDANRGVVCKNGFRPESTNGGRGLRCVKVEEKVATCDGGFVVERRTGTDRCVKRERDFFGNLVTTYGQYTIPANAGYLGIMGDPSRHGWRLLTDRNGTTDHWRKGNPDYQFAHVR